MSEDNATIMQGLKNTIAILKQEGLAVVQEYNSSYRALKEAEGTEEVTEAAIREQTARVEKARKAMKDKAQELKESEEVLSILQEKSKEDKHVRQVKIPPLPTFNGTGDAPRNYNDPYLWSGACSRLLEASQVPVNYWYNALRSC